MWFYGPKFLTLNLNEWPNSEASDDTAEELRVPYQVALISTKSNDVIEMLNERISKFSRMCRVFAYVCRAIKCFRYSYKFPFTLEVQEIKSVENAIYKYYQAIEYADVISCIENNVPISNKKLKQLNPFLDENGVLRVGGRLIKAELQYDSQHQIILNKNCLISIKIVRECQL